MKLGKLGVSCGRRYLLQSSNYLEVVSLLASTMRFVATMTLRTDLPLMKKAGQTAQWGEKRGGAGNAISFILFMWRNGLSPPAFTAAGGGEVLLNTR
jgi:hypothetical protein